MKKNLFKGSLFTVGASLWWGVIGVLYFKFVSFASALELTIHRTIWTALLLIITTSYYSKWSEFNKIIRKKVNDSIVMALVAIVHPITGGNAPAAPPITMFCGVFLFSHIV